MLELLKYLIFGHVHKWETIGVGSVKHCSSTCGKWFHERCVKCGRNRYRQEVG